MSCASRTANFSSIPTRSRSTHPIAPSSRRAPIAVIPSSSSGTPVGVFGGCATSDGLRAKTEEQGNLRTWRPEGRVPAGIRLTRSYRTARFSHMRRMFLITLLVLGLSVAAGSHQAPDLAAVFQELDTQLAADFAKDGIGGVSVGVVSGDALVWTKNYGYADAEAKRVANADTAYRIGSITKQFTALMLLKLAEEGKVRLTDPVEKHYPAITKVAKFHADVPSITLLQLATMTSGLAREPDKMPNHSVGAVSGWQQKVRDAVPFMRYQYEPGTQYLYSNIGYATLGLALEQAAGQSFTGYVETQILKPLSMSRSAWEATPEIRKNLAHGYTRRQAGSGAPTGDRSGPDRELEGRGYRVPNGALFSTVNDLAKFVVWELGGGPATVLKRETQT